MDSLKTPLSSLENQDKAIIEENQRFTKHSALTTLFLMSIGPFSLIVQAVAEVIDMLMITKRFKDDKSSHAVEILGFTGQLTTIFSLIGIYFGQSLTTRVSTLIGEGDQGMASHLVSDVVYLCVISSFIFAAILVFIIRPFLKFLNTPDYMINPTFKFLIPSLVLTPISNLANVGHYFCQSIGNSTLAGLVKVASYGLQIAVFSPLLLFAFKVNTTFMKFGQAIAGSLVGIGIMTLIYLGKFSLKPKFKDIFDKFCPDIKNALLYSIPMLLAFSILVIPPILILQTITSADKSHSEAIGGVFAVFTNIATVNSAIPGAFGQSFLSAGTYAFGCNNMKRLIHLFLWTLLFNGLLTLSVSLIVVPGKSMICNAFLKDQVEVDLALKMVPIPFYTSPLQGICMTFSILMITIGKPMFPFIPMLAQVIVLCAGSKIMANNFKNDIVKIMYVYNIADITVFVLDLIFIFIPINVIRKKIKEIEATTTVAENDNHGDTYKMI